MTWERVKLGDIALMYNGGTPDRSNSDYYEGETPWVTSADLQDGVIQQPRFKITDEAIQNSATRKMPQGSLLLVTRTGVGKIAVAPFDLCISQDFTGIIPDKSRADTQYLLHFIRGSQKYFLDRARGATIQGVTRDVVSKLEVPLPPLSVQQRIAAVLDEVDALRQTRERSLLLSSKLRVSTFSGSIQAAQGVTMQPLAVVCRKITDGTHHMPREVDVGIPILRVLNIRDGKIDKTNLKYVSEQDYLDISKRSPLEYGDVLITILGTIGNLAVFQESEPFTLVRNIAVLKPDYNLITSSYLMSALKLPESVSQMRSRTKTSTQSALYLGELKNIMIPVISIEKQNSVARMDEELLKIEDRFRKSALGVDLLFGALQSRAFSGELALRDLEAVL